MSECVCVYLPGTWEQRVTPLILLSTINQTVNMLAGGRRGCRGAPSNEALPCAPRKRTCIACAWAPSSSFISIRATSFICVWRSKGPKPHPLRIITFCFVCHSCGLAYLVPKTFMSLSFFIIIMIQIFLQLAFFSAFPDLFSSLLPNPSV